jgi:hypothetical protein
MIVDLWIIRNKHSGISIDTWVTIMDTDLPHITELPSLPPDTDEVEYCGKAGPSLGLSIFPMHVALRSYCTGYHNHSVHEEVL